MLGKPKYNYGDKVSFEIEGKTIVGEVYIIDAYGTFFQNKEVSYDIMVPSIDKQECLYKHITEPYLKAVKE